MSIHRDGAETAITVLSPVPGHWLNLPNTPTWFRFSVRTRDKGTSFRGVVDVDPNPSLDDPHYSQIEEMHKQGAFGQRFCFRINPEGTITWYGAGGRDSAGNADPAGMRIRRLFEDWTRRAKSDEDGS